MLLVIQSRKQSPFQLFTERQRRRHEIAEGSVLSVAAETAEAALP